MVDAFTDALFGGNPAGVCLLEREIPDGLMQSIAYENNLAETAFLLEKEEGYQLRWFTPEVEMDLCGHATLASAYVLMEFLHKASGKVEFQTQSGPLRVSRRDGVYTMDFPSRPPEKAAVPPLLEEALGCRVLETQRSRDLLVLVETEKNVRGMKPDMGLLRQISEDIAFAVIVTAKGGDCDFVSRFFAPGAGINEDPVTGSSHCTLIPYWSEKLQ